MQPSDSPSTTRTTRTTPSEPMAPMLYQSIHTLLHTVATKVKSPPSQALAQSYLCVCAAEIKICWPPADKKAQTLQSSPRTSHRGADPPPRPIRFCPGFPLCPSWFLRPLSSFSEHATRAVLSTGMRLVPSPFAKILSLLASFLFSLFPIVHFFLSQYAAARKKRIGRQIIRLAAECFFFGWWPSQDRKAQMLREVSGLKNDATPQDSS